MLSTLSTVGARGFIRPNVRILDDAEIATVAPSVFASRAWGAMSSKYRFIPTSDVLSKMRAEGFQPVKVQQSRCRIEGKGEFTKHLIRFRRTDAALVLNEVFPEVVLVNSHDGASSFQCYSGLFRLVCLNGMVTGMGNLSEYRTRHSGEIENVIDAAYRVVQDFPQITEQVSAWQSVPLSESQALAYADAARELRWEKGEAPIEPAKLLTVRRRDDAGNSLWLTYQRTQENLLKGGLGYMAPALPGSRRSFRRMHTRGVNSVSEDVKLNRALWSLTEKMAELVKA